MFISKEIYLQTREIVLETKDNTIITLHRLLVSTRQLDNGGLELFIASPLQELKIWQVNMLVPVNSSFELGITFGLGEWLEIQASGTAPRAFINILYDVQTINKIGGIK